MGDREDVLTIANSNTQTKENTGDELTSRAVTNNIFFCFVSCVNINKMELLDHSYLD